MPTRPIVRFAGVAAAAAALSWLVAAPALATAPPKAVQATPAPCRNGQLVNWLNTAGNGYAGGVGYSLVFTNVSAHACSLYGFPGVSAVNLAGHRIGVPATRDGSAHPAVTIAAGSAARADLLVTDTANYPPASCRAVTADGLRVYAPGLTASDVIPFPFSTCSTHTSSLSINSVT